MPSKRFPEPPGKQRDEASILNSIAHEVSTGLTYITVAHLAYDLGETERANRACAQALESAAEVRRLVYFLGDPVRDAILDQLESFRIAVDDCQDATFRFSPVLRQPSLS
ncbi:MAG: hypothetical protein JOY54_09505 [Acidobacteriaceae bacterium]|nr:hypothetical protein [Acidobacteriaceae bacterium]